MRAVKVIGLVFATIILLGVVALGAAWIFNPLATEIVLSDPTPDGRRVDEGDLIANFYSAKSSDAASNRTPAILLLGGSEGGIGVAVTKMALALQAENYAVLTMSYFGAPGQTKILEYVPLELFDQAIDWLKSQTNIDASRLGVMGVSKGAEAALIVATRHRELSAVVAAMPSNVAWQGIDSNILKQIMTPPGGSWSLEGEPIPYLPYVREYVEGPLDLYVKSLAKLANHPDSHIAVEKIGAPVLLICGEADTLWPSCDMARQVESRSKNRQGPQIKVLAFADAGHAGVGLPLDAEHPSFDQLASVGGTARGNNAARRDGWAELLRYLATAFESSGS